MKHVGSCFRDAFARLHVLHGQPAVILAHPPTAATPQSLCRPGEITAHISIAAGASWPDRLSAALAAGALRQDGVVALVFASIDDGMACASRIVHDNRANVRGGDA